MWKDAYEALEAAQIIFLRKFGAAMRTRAGSAPAMLDMLTRLSQRLASQTRRSEESEQFQQFSTPLPLGFVAAEAAMLAPADLVLEPSAGTGLLAIFAELMRSRLAVNEIAETRAGLLGRLFRDGEVTRHNAEHIHDRLDPAVRPTAVLMNPPFSASPHVAGRFAEAAIRHISSALARLAEGGRLVAITGHNVGPQLQKLAAALGLELGGYDLRSNKGGIAVSGEVTLHADRLYVQASQPATGSNTGILFRSCEGRRDYVGGANHFASLDLLHEPAALAALIRRHCVPRTPDQVRGRL